MKYKVTPSLCKTEPPEFEGFVVLDLPKYSEISKIQKKLTLKMIEVSGNKTDGDDNASKLHSIAQNIDAQEAAFVELEPMISEVELKHLKSGTMVRDVEEFKAHPVCRPIIEDLCLKLMFGFAEKN